jgi:phage FluMu protein Com
VIVLKSILIVCVVSAICAAIANPVFGIEYHKTFTASIAIQFVIGFIASAIRDALTTTKLKELQVMEIESYAKQGMELKCAHCNTVSFVPIRFDEHNTFDCPQCNSANAVYVKVTVARETSMMNNKPVSVSSINDDESIAIRSIKDE